jgi:predicted Zn-dependent protease
MSADSTKGGTPPGSLSLPKVEEFSTLLRTMFINIGFFAATLLLIPAVGAQFVRNAVVIEPIAVPDALVKQGFTPEVVANRLWDGLQDFAQSASAARETVVAIPDSQLIEFSLPDAGFSVDSIFTQIRQFFGTYDTRINGEIVCATSTCAREGIQLRLRVVRTGSDVVDLPQMGESGEREYYREAAAGVFAIIDPYVAIAAQAESAPLRAATLARRLIADGTKDAKWAHNLIGDIERRDGDPERAAIEYRAALALDESFDIARAGLAQALADAGDVEGAKLALAELEQRDPSNVLAPPILADIALKAGDGGEAIRQLAVAAEREPLNPVHATRAGKIALESGDREQGIVLLGQALSIDPAHGEALSLIARAHIESGDLAAAEAAYRQWLDYDPANVAAQVSLADMQLGFERFPQAVESYDRALALRPDPEVAIRRAGALLGLNRNREAIEALVEVTRQLPDNPLAFLLLARAYRAEGQAPEAIAAFERVLAIDPQGPNAASTREAIAALTAGS